MCKIRQDEERRQTVFPREQYKSRCFVKNEKKTR